MTIGWRRLLFFSTTLMLAGCFQQAGDSLQSTGNTAVPIVPNATTEVLPTATTSPTAIRLATAGPGTATLPPITIIVQPTEPASPATQPPGADTQGGPTTSGVQFITPGSPLGPSVESATPDPGTTATPSGLVTPTSLFVDGDGGNVSSECTYTVARGDTVFRIALANNTSVDAMRAVNPDLIGSNPIIQPGQVLNLPACGDEPAVDDEVPVDDEETVEATPTDIAPIITPAGGDLPTLIPVGQVYVVQAGDTLYTIAQRFDTTMAAIIEINDLANPDRLAVGDELVIPGDGNG